MRVLHDVPAPAKLNLFLHVTGRRPDGYHLLQSAFMLIDWCDTLHFELREDGGISREDLGAPLPAEDLIVRAARALQAATGCTQGAHIGVEKSIPAQAGLGGGSSDAASCLLALNRLWGLGLTRSELTRIGLSLGADVPFFLGGHNAWVEGIGETLQPITLAPARFLVIKPAAGLETARIFGHDRLGRNTKPATMADFAADPFGFGRNDLQPVASALCHDVREVLSWFSAHGLQGRMTGSGSAVFAHYKGDSAPDRLPDHWRMRLCCNLAVHPLAGWTTSDS
jgi:4-diphosphocytidyl-2-C-methyl-D-erythritol kinase